MTQAPGSSRQAALTSIEKALDVCEALSMAPDGHSVSELARVLKQPPATVHRLLAVLKRRGYVQQDEETSRYRLALKMLDLSFRALGRSELRLHAYPALREYVLRTGVRAFLALPRAGEVTYIWSTGPDAVAMHTAYGKQMPGHCAMYFDAGSARRLSCLRLERAADVREAGTKVIRFGDPANTANAAAGAAGSAGSGCQRLTCTCAPVHDYTGREVARVGLFAHDVTEDALLAGHHRGAWELARLISQRLGSVAAPAVADSA
jgi:IclR family transcriptional regulator, KDG regulon repressor